MEANIWDVNHLDADVVLPPRKRLLAGLKKHSSDGDSSLQLSLAASPASASASASTPQSSPSSNEFSARLSNLLSSHNADLSPEEILEASKSAATAALKAAEAARAAAEDKAAIAAKAVAAAKSALDLVACFPEESVKERHLKKNKLKKHVPVQLLYTKYQPIENCNKDEELARKLHRAINSSPRITKNSSGSDSKDHKHKKPKISTSSEKTRDSNGELVLEQNHTSSSNGHAAPVEVDF